MSRGAAEERYRQRRRTAFAEATRRLSDAGVAPYDELRLIEIDLTVIHSAMLVEWGSGRRVRWNWQELHARFKRNYPDRFELAVLCGNHICAFALGRPSKARTHCSLDYVEASPDQSHPLKGRVLPVVLTALERYCVAIGAHEMRIPEPLPGLIPLYEDKYAFSVVKDPGGHPYWRREVIP
jgi:hypothetical protein